MSFEWLLIKPTCLLSYFHTFMDSHRGVNYIDCYKRNTLLKYCKYADLVSLDVINALEAAGNDIK